jgi:8-oxo-dGTP pyrophosphatase MutT (NUDIX family)
VTEPKEPAAVVLVTRGDLVLALPRGRGRKSDPPTWLVDLHLPGGKEADKDHEHEAWDVLGLAVTAARELEEETGLRVRPEGLRHVIDLVSSSGRPVSAFAMEAPDDAPDHFEATDVGQPAWVPPGALVQPWCSFRDICGAVLETAGIDVPPGTAHAECPDCGRWLLCEEESGGLRLPVHRSHPEAPRSLALCSGSVAWLDDEGSPRIDLVTTLALAELVMEVRATASLAGALRDLGSRRRGLDAGPRR